MKHVLIFTVSVILSIYIGYIIKGNTSYQTRIGQSKSVKVDKTRYFFVGYRINNGYKNVDGNVQWFCYDGLLPNKREVCKYLQDNIKGVYFTNEHLTIVGLYEFKGKSECEQFHNQK